MKALNFFFMTYTSDFMVLLMRSNIYNTSCLHCACHFAKSADIVELLLEIMDERDLLGSNLSKTLDCLLAATEGEGPHKAEIQQIFLDYFNKKLARDFKDVEEIFAYHRHTFNPFENILSKIPSLLFLLGRVIMNCIMSFKKYFTH